MFTRLSASFAVLSMTLLASTAARGTPVKLTPIAVTVSSTYSGLTPQSAIDGDVDTYWNSGGFAPAWIQLDLGNLTAVSKVRLLPSMLPDGATTQSIAVGADLNSMRTVYTRSGATADNSWLEFSGDGLNGDRLGNIRYVRITTTASPSWIGWREIEVYSGLEYFG